MTTGGMGDRFGNADHGGQMKDMRDSSERLTEKVGIEDGSLKKTAGESRKVDLPSRGQVVQNGDGSPGFQMAGKVAANEAGTSCD